MRNKALLLLFIFLLNSATGFACALLMSGHGQEETASHHEAGHHHNVAEAAVHHHDGQKRVHPLSAQHHPGQPGITAKDDSCCQGLVNSFNTLAKVPPLSHHFDLLSPLFFVAAFYLFFLNPVWDVRQRWSVALNKRRRPPNHPIRITIQSFQI
ncbi:hypothetical protein LJ707_02450 [Mucilaginibacter sp. UR6-1]|uniref:hypothetical protein n=1 Tax=Mucilaginibacter sp. UR6-1 TaxID=1435643 RepID=UPI001E4FFB28|nr:hypothetical protein [Mucilaginibacter sp. UR6-1]MCC8407773.1 hypothetical protein [Mucilaginibacter sp. UR6-1]